MLLDLSGLDRNERIMIQASIGNERDFEKVAEALVVQHPRVHLKEGKSKPLVSRAAGGRGGGLRSVSGFFKGGHKKGKGKRRFRGFRTSHLATDEYGDTAYIAGDEEPLPDLWSDEEPQADPAHETDDEEDDEEEQAEAWAEAYAAQEIGFDAWLSNEFENTVEDR